MKEPRIEDSENILKKGERIEKGYSEEKMADVHGRLSTPFNRIWNTEHWPLEFDFERAHFIFEFEGADLDDQELIMNGRQASGLAEFGPVGDEQFSQFRRVRVAEFYVGNARTNLIELLPVSARIFIAPPSNNQRKGAGLMYAGLDKNREFKEGPAIFIFSDLATPVGISTLFHEIGHVIDKVRLRLANVKENESVTPHEYGMKAVKLRSERVANAFALGELRKFVDDPQMRSDLRKDLVNGCLRSYYQAAKDDIEEKENQFIFDFFRWSFSDGYGRWKKLDQFKDVPESQEYDKWRKWIKDTNYDYERDLHLEDDGSELL